MGPNRIAKYLGEIGACTFMPNTQQGIAVANTPLARVFARALEERWTNRPKTQLANAAKLNVKSIDRILDGSTTKATSAVLKLCTVLGINASAAVRGEYAVIGKAETDLHHQLDVLLGSAHGDTLRLQIESLYHLVARDTGQR